MGFRLNRVYRLEFEGAMEGAWLKLRSTPVATTLEMRGRLEADKAAALLAEYLIEWNFEDEKGEIIAFTPEAIMAELEAPVISNIILEWYKAAVGVTAPLDPPGTETDADEEEEQIPMETL